MKNKKIITFFLASSINDLEYDRLAVGDFINQLNNIYESSGIFIKLYKCESDSLAHSVSVEGSQASLDELIKSSDMCFVIFWHKAGDVTFHELKIAIDAYKKYDKPKVVVYFKKIADGDSRGDEVKEIMHIIDKELLHYHREYDHIDSLKLGIITQLQVHGFVNTDISVENDNLMYNNDRIMTVRNIPLFADNNEYTDLVKKYTEAKSRCDILQASYAADNGNYKVYRELGKAVRERDRLKADIDELSDNILNIGKSIASMTLSGKAVTDNIRKAIKCFDVGDYEGVLNVLDPADIEKSVAELDEAERNIIGERIAVVEEYRMRILALKAQARWSEVHDTFIKAVAQVENRPQMPKTVMYEYAQFLFQQTQYGKCIDICKALKAQCEMSGTADKRTEGKIFNLCGLAYYKSGKYTEAEKELTSASQIYKALSDGGTNVETEYAEALTNLAGVYYFLNKHAEAEALYNEALSIYYSASNSESVEMKIADIHMSLADLYYQINRHREAECLYIDALDACKHFADTQSSYAKSVSDIESRLAHMNCAILSHRHTDRYFVEALKVRGKLMRSGREAFSDYLQKIYNALIRAYSDIGYSDYADKVGKFEKTVVYSESNMQESAEPDYLYYGKHVDVSKINMWLTQALSIRRKLAMQNPEAYESDVAASCKNYAEFLLLTGDIANAEKYIDESTQIQKRLAAFSEENANASLATIYCSSAVLYFHKKEYDKAEKMYLDALDIYNASEFGNERARTYNHLGRMYAECGRKQDADRAYFESLSLYFELYRKSPGAYIDRVINTFANALFNICPREEKSVMSDLLLGVL